MTPFFAIATIALAATSYFIWTRARVARRAEFIRSFALPHGLFEKLQKRRPHLTLKDCQLVSKGLRQFFLAYLKGDRQFVSMPSQVADDLWHEFILHTKQYDTFCRAAFGGFLHHTPAVVLKSGLQSNAGLRRVWWHACREELINPKKATRLPLLFALDAKLNIDDGFRYAADCEKLRRQNTADGTTSVIYCGGDFSSSSIDGSTEGFGDSSSGSADSGGGDGGGGCSGGCGGGCGSD